MSPRRGRRPVVRDFSGLEATRPTITLVVDEMLDAEPLAPAVAHGARLIFINEVMPGAMDPDVAAFANLHTAIVATMNNSDFRQIISRMPEDNRVRHRKASLLAFTCEYERNRSRLAAVWDFVVSEWTLAQERPDKRVFLEIGSTSARTLR